MVSPSSSSKDCTPEDVTSDTFRLRAVDISGSSRGERDSRSRHPASFFPPQGPAASFSSSAGPLPGPLPPTPAPVSVSSQQRRRLLGRVSSRLGRSHFMQAGPVIKCRPKIGSCGRRGNEGLVAASRHPMTPDSTCPGTHRNEASHPSGLGARHSERESGRLVGAQDIIKGSDRSTEN